MLEKRNLDSVAALKALLLLDEEHMLLCNAQRDMKQRKSPESKGEEGSLFILLQPFSLTMFLLLGGLRGKKLKKIEMWLTDSPSPRNAKQREEWT